MRTIEDEICSLAGCSNIDEAVRALGILSEKAKFKSLKIARDWYRSGAETYLCRFSVIARDGSKVDAVVKACIGFSPAHPLDSILLEWVRRRKVITNANLSTPKLYGFGEGVVIEEAIPFTLVDAVAKATDPLPIIAAAATCAGRLTALGFRPVSLIPDMLSRGTDAVVVDFGNDLGSEQHLPDDLSDAEPRLRAELARFLADIRTIDCAAVLALFDREIASTSH